MTNERQASKTGIRALIERWARAVEARDVEGVLADHSDDIQMFDVPPPNELCGIVAYRRSWLPFFGPLNQGAILDLVSLDVTAGVDVAFATALLGCGTEEELLKDPTIGSARPSGCGRRAVAGSSRTSTIPFQLALDSREVVWRS
jgi:ketosteroid isomerase-like protein